MSKLAAQRRVARWLGARRGTWDGAKWADWEDDTVLVEAKGTCASGDRTQVPSALIRWWDKLRKEAATAGKEPVLLIDLPNGLRLAVVRAETVLVRDI